MVESRAVARQPARALPAAWLALEWALLLAALGVWAGTRRYTPLMDLGSGLLVASWLARWARTGAVTRGTGLDGWLLLFLASALAGLWAAPHFGPALVRLYLFLGATGLLYALTNSRGRELAAACGALTLGAATLAVYFATQHPWADAPAKFAAIGRVGAWLGGRMPDLGAYKPHPNVVAGILAVAAPVGAALLAEGVSGWRAGRRAAAWQALAAGLCLAAILAGVVLTESRAAWVALAGASGLAVWWLAAGVLGRAVRAPALAVFAAGLVLGAAAAAVAAVLRPAWVTLAFGSLPGPNSAVGRLEIFGQVWRLAQDTPFTGGGLDAFPALYSTYVLSIPSLLLTHAHNTYLNLLTEHGWAGLTGFLGLMLAAGWMAARALARPGGPERAFAAAGAAGLAIVAVQGLADATLVASRAIVVVFVPAGLAAAAAAEAGLPAGEKRPALSQRARLVAAAGLLAALVGAVWVWQAPLRAAWQANLGAVAYSRANLAGWPTGEWQDESAVAPLDAAVPALETAVRLDPSNRTAHYRLGLRASLARDFETAAAELEQAYEADPGHRGVIKNLGYVYAWLGRPQDARPLLAQIPEAQHELQVYVWWWGTQGREDLAGRAQDMARRLGR
jgi:O-antigen ligase